MEAATGGTILRPRCPQRPRVTPSCTRRECSVLRDGGRMSQNTEKATQDGRATCFPGRHSSHLPLLLNCKIDRGPGIEGACDTQKMPGGHFKGSALGVFKKRICQKDRQGQMWVRTWTGKASPTAGGPVRWCRHYGKVWRVLEMLNVERPQDPAVPLLGLPPQNPQLQRNREKDPR